MKCFISIVIFSMMVVSLQGSDIKNKKTADSEKWIEDQVDETDAYAIPLDSSEAEESQELKKFEEGEQNLD